MAVVVAVRERGFEGTSAVETTPELAGAAHVLSADDVLIVTSVRRRIAASTRALFEGGFRKWIARRRFHALATELAFHSWRASRYRDPDEAEIRAELVAAVRDVRAKLGLSLDIEPPDPQLVARLTGETPLPVRTAPAM